RRRGARGRGVSRSPSGLGPRRRRGDPGDPREPVAWRLRPGAGAVRSLAGAAAGGREGPARGLRLTVTSRSSSETGLDESRLWDTVREFGEAGWLLEEGDLALSLPMLHADDALVSANCQALVSLTLA